MKDSQETTYTAYRTEVKSVTCDVCLKKYKGDNWEGRECSEKLGVPYDTLETTIKMDLTMSSGWDDGGGESERCQIDICPTCFKEKLISWVKEQGSDVKIKKSFW